MTSLISLTPSLLNGVNDFIFQDHPSNLSYSLANQNEDVTKIYPEIGFRQRLLDIAFCGFSNVTFRFDGVGEHIEEFDVGNGIVDSEKLRIGGIELFCQHTDGVQLSDKFQKFLNEERIMHSLLRHCPFSNGQKEDFITLSWGNDCFLTKLGNLRREINQNTEFPFVYPKFVAKMISTAKNRRTQCHAWTAILCSQNDTTQHFGAAMEKRGFQISTFPVSNRCMALWIRWRENATVELTDC